MDLAMSVVDLCVWLSTIKKGILNTFIPNNAHMRHTNTNPMNSCLLSTYPQINTVFVSRDVYYEENGMVMYGCDTKASVVGANNSEVIQSPNQSTHAADCNL